MTERLSTPIQRMAVFKPECHKSFDRNVISYETYDNRQRERPRPLYVIHCHFLPLY